MSMLIAILALTASQPTTPFVACLHKNLPALEMSGEQPNDVAAATWGMCKGEFEKASMSLENHSPERVSRLLEYARNRVVPTLATRVVRMRACRHTAGCSVSKMPWDENF